MKVFVSYRRADAGGHAGRLHDDLVTRLGPGSVFHDIASIAPGEQFLDAIDRSIGECDVVLAVIGRRWMETDDQTGRHRLDEPHDVVRNELETALRTGRPLVPVLVDRATLPGAADLPPTLRPLLERNAIELRDEAWAADLQRLATALGVPATPTRRRSRRLLTAAVAVAVLTGVVVAIVRPSGGNDGDTSAPLVSLPTTSPQPWPAEQTVTATYSGDVKGQVSFTVQKWWRLPDAAGEATVSVQVKVTDNTRVAISVYPDLFVLLVDQVRQSAPDIGRLGPFDHPSSQQATEDLVVFSHVPSGRKLELLCGYDPDRKPVVLQDG